MTPVTPSPRRALTATEIVTQLSDLNGEDSSIWRPIDGALEKTFRFSDFYETMAFVNALAFIAHAENHHPDMAIHYSHCVVRFHTHDIGGISTSDFLCASKVNALLS